MFFPKKIYLWHPGNVERQGGHQVLALVESEILLEKSTSFPTHRMDSVEFEYLNYYRVLLHLHLHHFPVHDLHVREDHCGVGLNQLRRAKNSQFPIYFPF